MRKTQQPAQLIRVQVEPELKSSVERIFSKIGISTDEAIRLFFEQVAMHKNLPFVVEIPNAETVAAMSEANDPATLERFLSFQQLRERH